MAVVLKPALRHPLLSILAALLLLGGCDSGSSGAGGDGLLGQIRARGELVVLTRNAPTIYYVGQHGLAGPEHDMAVAFGRSLGVKTRFVVLDDIDDILTALAQGKGDIAAAGLADIPQRRKRFLAGPMYQKVRQQVVCRRGGARPKTAADLVGLRLAVAARSSYVRRLQQLKQRLPGLSWDTVADVDTEELLVRVWQRKIDCTVADSNIVAVNRRYHPELAVRFDISAPQELVWYMPAGATGLRHAVQSWLTDFRSSGDLDDLFERYYGFINVFDYVDTRKYLRRIHTRLPPFRAMFERAGKRFDLPWTLLAAQAYQESHWKSTATSPTGVRGIMMLTRDTARELGIKDRLHPQQSIFGGAHYLSDMRDRLDETIHEPDRTWMALAAYNIGLGHVRDARGLAARLGKDPDSWHDLKEVLPLLSQRRYYRSLDSGYGRGEEAVRYVSRIRNFHDLLVRELHLNPDQPTAAGG
jgi:membrane-bound lytic murein transglycosylase F